MDKSRKYVTATCEICSLEYSQQERLYKKAKWKNRCKEHRKSMETNKCSDCGIIVDKCSIRCKPCSGKSRSNPIKHCEDCGIQINRKAKSRCLSCHNKNQDKGLSRARTKFNASKKWSRIRIECFERDNYTCTVCGVRGGTVLNAHHIIRYADCEELRLELSNLVTVCVPCHKEIHRKKDK